MIGFFRILLKGLGQVMLQENEATGALFLLGIFFNSWVMGLGALIGVLFGTLAALFLKYEKKNIEKGLYGANGALVGIALLFFFKANAPVIALAILGAMLSSIVMETMRKRIPPYTFPFVITTLVLLAAIGALSLAQEEKNALSPTLTLDFFSALAMGFGQVMFQGNVVTGVIFLLAILASSRISGAYAFLGSFLGLLVAFVLSFPLNLINIGIFGFNGVLCGIAFSGKEKNSVVYAILSIALSVLIIYGMNAINFPALTAPFVLSTWIVLGLKKR